jgi:hypothetical protein
MKARVKEMEAEAAKVRRLEQAECSAFPSHPSFLHAPQAYSTAGRELIPIGVLSYWLV